ncbi:hypothetical protein DFQ26_004865 [Actinomortierella ambigua]|nr:hypothetical protein DFQ26_004865 [Actinomortierella ambigua]
MSSRASSLNLYDKELPYDPDEIEYLDVATTYSEEKDDGESVFKEYCDSRRPIPIRFYQHRRFWVFCMVLTVVFLAIFVPLFIVYILPIIAQEMMNSANMQVIQMNMTQPTETNMHVSVHASVLGIPKIFSATLEFQEQVVVTWNNRLIGSMNLAPVQVKNGNGDFWQETTFYISDTAAFGDFVKTLSKATVKAFGLSIKDLKIDKMLPMNGLSNFANVQLQSFDLPRDAPEGAHIYIRAEIPNPSPIGMTLGTITFDLSYKTAYLGQVTAKGVTLIGGQPMMLVCEGVLLKQTDPVHLEELSELISNYLGDIPSMASAQGVSVFPDGVNQVSWITNAITSTKMTIPIKAVQKLEVIKDIEIKDMDLSITAANPWMPTVTSTAVRASFKIPFSIGINITDLGNTVLRMAYQGQEFTLITTATWNRTMSDMANNKIVFTIPPTQVTIQEAGQDAFQKFLTSVTQQDASTLEVMGAARGVADTSLGTVVLHVPLKTSVQLQGINFSAAKPTVSDIKVTNGTTEGVTITANIAMVNPSIFSVSLGRVNLMVSCTIDGQTEVLGMATIPSMIIRPGQNTLAGVIDYHPANTQFGNKFLSTYVAGGVINATIIGYDQSSDIASIAPTLASLRLTTMLPGMTPPARILTGGNGAPTLGAILGSRRIPFTVTAMNPLDTTIWLNAMTVDVFWRDTVFGSVRNARIPFALLPHVEARSPEFIVQCPTGFQFALFLVTQFLPLNPQVIAGGTVAVDIRASLETTLGGASGIGYPAALNYQQKAVPAFLKLDVSFVGLTKRSYGTDHPESEIDNHTLYDMVTSKIGYEPSIHDTSAYIRWLQRSLTVLYPEEAKVHIAD